MGLVNTAVAEQTSGKAREFSDKAITSSLNSAEKITLFLWITRISLDHCQDFNAQKLTFVLNVLLFVPNRITKHMLYLSQMEKACSWLQLYSSTETT